MLVDMYTVAGGINGLQSYNCLATPSVIAERGKQASNKSDAAVHNMIPLLAAAATVLA